MRSPRARALLLISITAAASAVLFLWYRLTLTPHRPVAYGVTFSTLYAQELGLDWKAAYLATLDDLGVRRLRLPVYWNAVEKEKGVYDWSEVDWMLDEAGKRGAEIILAVGRKTPRWPECHLPARTTTLAPEVLDQETLGFLEAEVLHFKTSSAVKIWQVENEPLFRFGNCPPPDHDFLKREVELVHGLDARPVMLTDSGEMSTWLRTGALSDVLGVSLYRLVWNRFLRELYWPFPPAYYADHMAFLKPLVSTVIVSELQAEPWFHRSVQDTPLEEQFRQMNPERLRANVAFAASTGASEVYLWGVEWWFWLAQRGHPELWQAAKNIFR